MTSSNDRINVGAVQCTLNSNADENFCTIHRYIQKAAQQGCQLLVLPELHQGRYPCQTENPDLFEIAETIPGPTTDKLAALAKQYQIVIIASVFEKRMEGVFHNTAVVLENNGRLAGCYRKMHIPDDPGYHEKFYFTPGDSDNGGFIPIKTSLGMLGILVCWDQWFPEAARLMALAGAEILIYPTAIGWDQSDSNEEQARQLDAWITVQRGHAIANHLPLICCNRTGFESHPDNNKAGIQFWGNSFISGAQGEYLAQSDDHEQGLLTAHWDKSRTRQLRRLWPFLRDRRIDSYHALLKRSNIHHE